jgi:murein DD-endopeptidase MepM/ murein hydrolase activator NlpD
MNAYTVPPPGGKAAIRLIADLPWLRTARRRKSCYNKQGAGRLMQRESDGPSPARHVALRPTQEGNVWMAEASQSPRPRAARVARMRRLALPLAGVAGLLALLLIGGLTAAHPRHPAPAAPTGTPAVAPAPAPTAAQDLPGGRGGEQPPDALTPPAALAESTAAASPALPGADPPAAPTLPALAVLPLTPPAPPVRYTVQAGDTLAAICGRYGATVDTVAAANGLADPSRIYPGQVLLIPQPGGPPPVVVPPGTPPFAPLPPSGLPPHTPDYAVVAPPSISVEGIEIVLARYHSPAQGLGPVFYQLGVQYGVDPAYALAFFAHESHAGTRGLAAKLHSIGMLRAGPGDPQQQGYRAYDTWEAGIEDWYRTMRTQYVGDLGLTQAAAIAARYAGPDDPQDLASFVGNIQRLVDSWNGTAVVPQAPYVTPGPVARADLLPHVYHLTSEFGQYPEGGAHYGLDLNAKFSVPQTAPVGGTVEEVHRGCVQGDAACGRGWGNHIWWQSAVTGHHILLAHFAQIDPAVQVGAQLHAGMLLGLTGMTGYATGPHVHIQVNPLGPADPGSVDASWEFPWLSCGQSSPRLRDPWGATVCVDPPTPTPVPSPAP